MIAGQVEGFYVIGRQGTEWHPVSDDIAWSVSDSSMGTFMKDFGVFVSNGSIAETTTGKVTAKVGSTILSRDLTIIAREDLSSLSGIIKDKNGDPVTNAIVEIHPAARGEHFGPGMAIADENGAYRIEEIPDGTYTMIVRSLFGGEPLAHEPVTVKGPTVKDINLAGVVTTLFACARTQKIACKPGGTMYLQINMTNMGSKTVDYTYDSIEFRLRQVDYPENGGGTVTIDGSTATISREGSSTPGSPGDGGISYPEPAPPMPPSPPGIIIATAKAPGGTVQVGRLSEVLFPSTSVALVVPQDAPTGKSYYVEAVLVSAQKVEVAPAFVIIGEEPQPIPMPEPTEPMPMPTATMFPEPTTEPGGPMTPMYTR